MHIYLAFIVLCSSCVLVCFGDDNFPTTASYDYKNSGARRWQLNKGNGGLAENIFKKDETIDTDTTRFPDTIEIPDESQREADSSEFNSEALKSFLNTYAKKFKKPDERISQEIEDKSEHPEGQSGISHLAEDSQNADDKSKSWDLMAVRKSNHPFDHKAGWVSLEAVPWSVSKVSKWEGKPNVDTHKTEHDIPKIPSHHHQAYPPPNYQHDDEDRFVRPDYKPKPSYSTYKPHYNDLPPDENGEDETYYRPTRPNYSQSPFNKYSPHNSYPQSSEIVPDYDQRPPVRRYTTQKPFNNNRYQSGPSYTQQGDLITDGKPPNFPSYNDYYNRRISASLDDRPSTHPQDGNGEWILLSTSKGYKYPKNRQRSLQIAKDSIGVHRSVRLTVLPPLEDSNINMTTSHGGLLQVESTFQSVEDAQKQHVEKEKLKRRKTTTVSPPRTKKPWRAWRKKFQTTASTDGYINSNEQVDKTLYVPKTATLAANQAGPDSAAVLAAVGAGMIPATMAMLVPMAMSGRRKRSTKYLIQSFPLLRQ